MPARRREPLAREEPAELQVAATNGSIVTDSRGRKYIDFVMGWCVGNFGWRPAESPFSPALKQPCLLRGSSRRSIPHRDEDDHHDGQNCPGHENQSYATRQIEMQLAVRIEVSIFPKYA